MDIHERMTNFCRSARPIISTLEVVMGVDARAIANPESIVGMSGMGRGVLKIVIRGRISSCSFVEGC